jgi:hypothetical protein
MHDGNEKLCVLAKKLVLRVVCDACVVCCVCCVWGCALCVVCVLCVWVCVCGGVCCVCECVCVVCFPHEFCTARVSMLE